jgi:hypothetical protein
MRLRFVALVALFVALFVAPAAADPKPNITYCHRTDAVDNPYVAHTTDADSIIKEGHGSHTGPIFPETGPNGKWGDIIPPFDYTGGHFPGLNWNAEGATIVAAKCLVVIEPIPPDETSTTTEATTTTTTVAGETTLPGETTAETTAPAGETSSTGAGATEPETSSTFVAEGTTAPPAGATTTTSTATSIDTLPGEPPATNAPPPLTDPGAGIEIMPVVHGVVLIHHNGQLRVVDLGELSPAQRIVLEEIVDQIPAKTAFTGSDTSRLLALAAVLVFAGGALVVRRRPRRI